jgi:hypothetical protein
VWGAGAADVAGETLGARERSDEVHEVEGLGGVSHSKEGGAEHPGKALCSNVMAVT